MKENEQTGTNEHPPAGTIEADGKSDRDDPPQHRLEPERSWTRRLNVWKHTASPGAGIVVTLAGVVVALLVFLFGTDVIGRLEGDEITNRVRKDAAQTESGERKPRLYATYSFKKTPFVHPKIINEFVGNFSNVGDQVVAINLVDSQDSNRYFGEITVTPQLDPSEPSWPWVYSIDGEKEAQKGPDGLWDRPSYAYRWVGSTKSQLDVLHVKISGGGSGIFNSVVFTRIEVDQGVDYPLARDVESRTEAARPEIRVRELLRFVGRIPLGDRWLGTIEVDGNDVVVRGRDLYERCELGGVTIMEALEMAHFMNMNCRDGPPGDPPQARAYEAPAVGSGPAGAGQ